MKGTYAFERAFEEGVKEAKKYDDHTSKENKITDILFSIFDYGNKYTNEAIKIGESFKNEYLHDILIAGRENINNLKNTLLFGETQAIIDKKINEVLFEIIESGRPEKILELKANLIDLLKLKEINKLKISSNNQKYLLEHYYKVVGIESQYNTGKSSLITIDNIRTIDDIKNIKHNSNKPTLSGLDSIKNIKHNSNKPILSGLDSIKNIKHAKGNLTKTNYIVEEKQYSNKGYELYKHFIENVGLGIENKVLLMDLMYKNMVGMKIEVNGIKTTITKELIKKGFNNIESNFKTILIRFMNLESYGGKSDARNSSTNAMGILQWISAYDENGNPKRRKNGSLIYDRKKGKYSPVDTASRRFAMYATGTNNPDFSDDRVPEYIRTLYVKKKGNMEIGKFSNEQQISLWMVDAVMRTRPLKGGKSGKQLFAEALFGNEQSAMDLYTKVHHTSPDESTSDLVVKNFGKGNLTLTKVVTRVA